MRLPAPLAASRKQLRLLLFSRRCFTSSSPPPPPQPHRLLHPHLPLSKPSFPTTHSLSPPFSLPSRFFSSHPDPNPDTEEHLALAQSLSSELLKDPTTDPLSLTQRLDLNFSHIKLTPSVILQTLDLSPGAGRAVLGFHKWASSRPDFKPDDETLSHFVNYLGRRKDFKAAHDVLVAGRGVSGAKTLESAIDRLVRAGRQTQVIYDGPNLEDLFSLSISIFHQSCYRYIHT